MTIQAGSHLHLFVLVTNQLYLSAEVPKVLKHAEFISCFCWEPKLSNTTKRDSWSHFQVIFPDSKIVDKLDNLQVNTQTVQSTEVDPNQTESLDLRAPVFHWHLSPDPKISVGPIIYKGVKQTRAQITFLFFFLLKLWKCLTLKQSTEHHFLCCCPVGWLLTVEGKHRSFEAQPVKNQRFE